VPNLDGKAVVRSRRCRRCGWPIHCYDALPVAMELKADDLTLNALLSAKMRCEPTSGLRTGAKLSEPLAPD